MGAVNAREAFPGGGPMAPPEPEAEAQIPLDNIKAKVVSVSIDGLNRTKDDIVMDSVKDLFKVEQFEDLILTAQDVRGKLQELGCFSNVGINIDTSSTGAKDYTVTFQVWLRLGF